MHKYTILLCFLLISNSLYSQTGYPKSIVYNGDTVVAITRHQLERINIAHEVWQGSIQQSDSLLTILDSCHIGFLAADSAIHFLQSVSTSDRVLIAHQKSTIDTLVSVISTQKKMIQHLKVHRTLSTIGEGILGAIALWLLLR